MDNPGLYSLTFANQAAVALAIAGAGTFIGDVVGGQAGGPNLEGALSASIEAKFAWGAGGTSVTAYVQTSLDGGQTWMDVVALQFTTTSATSVVNLSGLTPKTTPVTPTNQSLSAGTCVDGFIGDRWRVVVVVVGSYSASTLLTLALTLR